MPRGTKICHSCNSVNGPRAYSCKSCAAPFTLKRKPKLPPEPVAKSNTALPPKKRKRRTKEQMLLAQGKKPVVQKDFNWRDLKKGDEIKVLGGGPYWPREPEDGGDISIGYSGIFTVKYVDEHGIHAYGKNEDNGHSYIYMGVTRKSNSGTIMATHKIAKVNRRIKDE